MKIIVVVILLTFLPGILGAQAWTRQKGHGYGQIGYSVIKYNALYAGEIDNLDQIPLPREVTDRTFPIYAEYGFRDKFTFSLELPVKRVLTNEINSEFSLDSSSAIPLPSKGELTGLGNIRLSAIYNILKKDYWSGTAKLRMDASTASYDQSTGLRTGTSIALVS